MKLTPQEREIIYQEELEKRRKEKLENLTEEEREKIYQDGLPKNETTADGTMVVGPKIHLITQYIIFILTIILLLAFFGLYAIIIGGIVGLIFGGIKLIINPSLLAPTLFLTCPLCKSDVHLELTQMESEFYHKKNFITDVTCNKCKGVFKLDYRYNREKKNNKINVD